MAMRSVVRGISLNRLMEGSRRTPRYFSDGKGKVFNEEEKAAENIYIQRKERERMEKLKQKMEKEKDAGEKEKSEKLLKKTEERENRKLDRRSWRSYDQQLLRRNELWYPTNKKDGCVPARSTKWNSDVLAVASHSRTAKDEEVTHKG